MTSKILIPVDIEHPKSWTSALAEAQRLFPGGDVELHAVYVLPRFGSALVGSYFPADFESRALEAASGRLAELLAETDTAPLSPPTAHIAHGVVYEQILMAADRLGVDLVMMQAQRPGAGAFLLGSNAAKVARHARQSVLLLR